MAEFLGKTMGLVNAESGFSCSGLRATIKPLGLLPNLVGKSIFLVLLLEDECIGKIEG